MKKVYGCTPTVFIVTTAIVGFAFLIIKISRISLHNLFYSPEGIVIFAGVLCILYLIRTFTFPVLIYDENGFEKLGVLGTSNKSHNWNDVKEIRGGFAGSRLPSSNYPVFFGDLEFFTISSNLMVNHSKVLSDVVGYVQKNNPNAKIDSRVFERVEKPESWYENGIVLYSLIISVSLLFFVLFRFLKPLFAH